MKKDTDTNGKKTNILLGIETSGKTCAAGVSVGGDVRAECTINIPNVHSEKLAPLVEQTLKNAGLVLDDLSGIILSAGPGSFTGLRIGYSLAKGYAYALDIPLVEVSTLDVWAHQCGDHGRPILPVVDARRGDIYCAEYSWHNSKLERTTEYSLIPVKDVGRFASRQVLVTGVDADYLKEDLLLNLPNGGSFLVPAPSILQITSLLALGSELFEEGKFASLVESEPLYMRAFHGVS